MKTLYLLAGCNGADRITAAYTLLPGLLGNLLLPELQTNGREARETATTMKPFVFNLILSSGAFLPLV